jgi:hypothetical protein
LRVEPVELEVLEDDPDFETFMRLADVQQTYRAARAQGNAGWMLHLAQVFERYAQAVTERDAAA